MLRSYGPDVLRLRWFDEAGADLRWAARWGIVGSGTMTSAPAILQ